MTTNMCLNGTTDSSKYSAPVPVIGLYIAVGSLICFILIFCDVWAGFRNRKLWFPCRFFSLNSITLTLIFSVATKIPVDLTTEMPSAQDQLAKLTGTIFICMAMGFMNPSVGSSGEFESYANVTALSISVITVFVNVCIQMATGVIFSFMVEHSIILFCMLLLIVRFWFTVVEANSDKDYAAKQNNDLIEEGKGNMLKRLEFCYLYAYFWSPQYKLCRDPYLNNVPLVCSICSLVLVEALLRSLDLKFCGGVSDYKWSVWLIVASQVITVILISLAIGFRWLTFGAHIWLELDNEPDENDNNVVGIKDVTLLFLVSLKKVSSSCYLRFLHLFTSINLWKSLEVSFKFVIYYPLFIIECCLAYVSVVLVFIINTTVKKLCPSCIDQPADAETLKRLGTIQGLRADSAPRAAIKGLEDMDRCMKKNEDNYPKCLIELLRKVPATQTEESLPTGQNLGSRLSSLSILLLVELAKLATPVSLHASLTDIIEEVFQTIHFIDDKVNIASTENQRRSRYAKIIWNYGLFRMGSKSKSVGNATTVESQLKLAFKIITETLVKMDLVDEVDNIADSLGYQLESDEEQTDNRANSLMHQSHEEIYNRIQQIFVDRLRVILQQLPRAIFKYIIESPVEEYERRVRLGFGLVCRYKCLEQHMCFSFPSGSNITSFATALPEDTDSMPSELPLCRVM